MMRAPPSKRTTLCLQRLEDRFAPAIAYWVGDRPTSDWQAPLLSNNTNWSDDQSPEGKALVFDSSAVGHFSNNNDYKFLDVESLTFNAEGYTLSGNPLSITTAAGITQNLGTDGFTQINLGINLAVSQTWTAGGAVILDGRIAGAGALTLAQVPGVLGGFALSHENTYTGATLLQSGVLYIDSNKALGSASAGTTVRSRLVFGSLLVDGAVNYTEPEPLTLAGGRLETEFKAVTFAGPITLASNTGSPQIRSAAGTMTFTGPVDNVGFPLAINAGAGRIELSGVVSGAGGLLVFDDGGTVTLAGNNTYTGTTHVEDGTLFINGAQPASPVRVNATSTLGGIGTTGPITILPDPPATLSLATLSPGAGPGTGILTAHGEVTLNSAKFAVDLHGASAGAGYDQLKVLGGVLVSGTTLLLDLNHTPAPFAQFTIIDNDGADTVFGTFKDWPEGSIRMVNGTPLHITYKGGDGNDVVLTRPTSLIVTAPDAGAAPRVRVFEAESRQQRSSFLAYPAAFKGGVRVASADINNDGIADIITAPGPGTPALVKVFSGAMDPGQPPALLYQFKPFGRFKGGAHVAVGDDISGDDVPDIIVGSGAGMGSLVKIYSGADGAPLGSFAPFGGFSGGVTVAAGDVDGDQDLDIITGMGPGSKPRVRVFDAATRTRLPGAAGSILAYDAAFRGGVFVAAADINGDTVVITGPGAGAAPFVKVFYQGVLQRQVRAYPARMRNGVRVAAAAVTGDDVPEILTALGPGGNAQVRIFDSISLAAIDSFFAETNAFTKGLFVAGNHVGL